MEQQSITDFESIVLRLASPDEILSWSRGEVLKPETINYRTQRPEKDGLFCEKIFGPEKDWECYCGKYKKIRYKGIVCDKCGVEVTRAVVRRERMGHLKLASPVSHIWFLRSVPSKMGLVLDISVGDLEKVVYFAGYVVTKVDEEAKKQTLQDIEKEYKQKSKEAEKEKKEAVKAAYEKAKTQLASIKKLKVYSEVEYYDISMKYGDIFEASTGAETLRKLMEEIDLPQLKKKLIKEAEDVTPAQRKRTLQRLKIADGLIKANLRPEWMFLSVVPIIPPDLRPMVQLDGGRYATSDLNDLYRRVINRNNRLKKLNELNAPEVICRNEKRMLQEAVDALIDNSARKTGAVVTSAAQKRPLKSLADILKGKQGRFRQNLLGKRVDYSARSVIVVGPELKLHQCGLPKKMALELFKPFVIQKLIERGFAHHVKAAGRLIEEVTDDVWAILEEVVSDKCVLLNRAPTLHRLGIQAFYPILVEGEAIRLHPLVCPAFNADFDGDQMAVHLPLTEEAQREAREIMLSSKNLLKPATGDPIATPSQDIILGCYYMTDIRDGEKGEGKMFYDEDEAILTYDFNEISLRAKILVKKIKNASVLSDSEKNEKGFVETSVGRIIFNQALPSDFAFVNKQVDKKTISALIGDIFQKYGIERTAEILDQIKEVGFTFATKSGISWGYKDLDIPPEKAGIIKKSELEVETVFNQYQQGLLTDDERYNRVIEIWRKAMSEISAAVPKVLKKDGSVYTIIASGARGSWSQPTQMAGIKGLVANPAGRIIELPVKSNFKEGFDVLEYFISTHGARKGTADTALRTASAGYLTRRLVDVSQDVIITGEDCGDKKGFIVYKKEGEELRRTLASRIWGRCAASDISHPKSGKVLVPAGEIINKETAKVIEESGIDEVNIRSVIACKSIEGVCQTCYGYDLGVNKMIEIGQPIGIVAAQAIGEPGTQLTMRTFHTGGVAGGEDITGGLPRVVEIFEARIPRGLAVISEVDGIVEDITERSGKMVVKIKSSEKKEVKKRGRKNKNKEEGIYEYEISRRSGIWVKKGELVVKGTQLSEGHLDLHNLFENAGADAVQRYIFAEVQKIYSLQGAAMNDKHIEVIIRQMFSRLAIKDAGDTLFVSGEIIEKTAFNRENRRVKENGGAPATAVQLLLGITRVALTTESFLSAASFQETTKVLISAAIEGKEDKLRGLKENVIIGRLIPTGTGYRKKS